MTAATRPAEPRTAAPAITAPSTLARLFGLGSVFGKAFRDSRRTALILGLVFGGIATATAAQIVAEFTTPASRLAFAHQLSALPAVFQGMLGAPIHIETLGGFVSWRIFNFLPVMLGIWSIVAASGSLAGELSRGSLDFVAATPVARRRVAVEKVLAYLAAVALATLLIEGMTYVAVNAMATLPGDSVSVSAVAGHSAWVFLTVLAPGALAFLVAPIVGRGGALAVGGGVLFLSFVVSAYGDVVPAFDALKPFSYLHLTAGHRPLAGQWDWPAIGLLAALVGACLVAGIAIFERRDLLAPSPGRFRVPAIGLWVRGVLLRGLGERLPGSLIWGFVLGLYGLLIATSADEFVTQLGQIPQMLEMIRRIYPGADILSTGGFLQLTFFAQGLIMMGLAAAVAVASWASDEGDRRLEVILAAPISRAGWALRSGASVFVGLAITTALMGLGTAAGAALQGDAIGDTLLGVGVLGLYGMALAGIGLAVGGLIRPSLAAPATAIIGLGSYLLDLVGSILKLPDPIMNLALNRHLGRPILGEFDGPGLVACAVLALGGLVVCAVGVRRRDVGR